jgi:hypothetical protein
MHLREITADPGSTESHQRKITGHQDPAETYLKEIFIHLGLQRSIHRMQNAGKWQSSAYHV